MLISNVGINPAAYLNNHSVENSSQTASQSVSAKDILGNDSNLLIVFYVQIMPDDF
uniref:hypothetical protein n=1 Tax=Salmonella enterica TaxID=28901 RepID=UPI0036D24BA3